MYGTRRDWICDDDDDVVDDVAMVVSAEGCDEGDKESWCAIARRWPMLPWRPRVPNMRPHRGGSCSGAPECFEVGRDLEE